MGEVIKFLAEVVNTMHDLLIVILAGLGFELTDKQLHFWIIGILGMGILFAVHPLFKWIAKWNIFSLSFVYTFTVLVVIVFAIEIQQKITNRGNMEFQDAVIGLWGFLVFFLIYLGIKGILFGIQKLIEKVKKSSSL
ncbi:hypothetical protein [Bacillus taeanensis]|uniref:Uncharacterized protein n=1 Tax=Bacillus taeanensis TaxID=273032 RepID=A0A366XPJ9_9BACI|nr:hypothetical protein [Bacillus taeanensis]RBW67827.1 hypothetical protein DS031_19980 [Bacillus taeanensis]